MGRPQEERWTPVSDAVRVGGDGSLRAAADVARRYYLDGRSKVEIAAELGLSRFKVARLLDLANEAGIVRIEIVEPVEEQVLELAEEVRSRWGLKDCRVVPTSTAAAADVGQAAAELLVGLLGPQDVLGLPWSRSVHAMVDIFTTLPTVPAVPIVQLSGAMASSTVDSSTIDLVRRASRKAGAGRKVFFAPLVMPDREAADAVRRDPAVRDTLAAASTVTVAMVGVGGWGPGSSTIYDAVDEPVREEVADAGAVGEVAGIFFDVDGGIVETDLSARIIALSPAHLTQIPTVLSSAHQVERVPALAAALRGGLVNTLVVTADVAEELLTGCPGPG
ncbi:sugar-binding transcriptional regulator [Ornithinimicrobium sufpigmenti]|uniref:sugar-binding transcriptional regulator n=1 Tax=Ornithinimicrobium sufpigmenti TaxID=2508882 RepID=UPI0015E1B6A7|nr:MULTISPECIES: sugar-binding domain-containing protein [unclassified Ornithinimicrobium]